MDLHSSKPHASKVKVKSRQSALGSWQGLYWPNVAQTRASDFPFQKKQFSVSKKVKFRFDSVSLSATLNSMKSQYIERKCGERTIKMAQLVR